MLRLYSESSLDKLYQYLILSLAFFFPLSVAIGNLIIAIIVILWLVSGNYKEKFLKISNNRLALLSIAFFVVHLVGLLWTDDLSWGFVILKKMWDFLLLFPILLTITRKQNVPQFINSFLLSMFVTIITSLMVWLELIDPIMKASVENPSVTMSTISYNVYLAIASYIVLYRLLFEHPENYLKFFYILFTSIVIFDLFITGGRAGQALFIFLLGLIIFQFFKYKILKSSITLIILSSLIFGLAYENSTTFNKRTNETIDNFDYRELKNTSLGQRYTYFFNSIELIKLNPILGVGTGDFPKEYSIIHSKNSPSITQTVNPHNMYLLVIAQLGFLGLVSMLSIFLYQLKCAIKSQDFARNFGLALPLGFLLIMVSDSYLLGHFTTILYVFFSSMVYQLQYR